MTWKVTLLRSADKQLPKLPRKVIDRLVQLLSEIESLGPVRGNWPNYSRLGSNRHHCHLRKGRPTYVAVWLEDKDTITVEVEYVGTHEKAPY